MRNQDVDDQRFRILSHLTVIQPIDEFTKEELHDKFAL